MPSAKSWGAQYEKLLLYGHGGDYNHGTEAVQRSSLSIFRRAGVPILLSAHFPKHRTGSLAWTGWEKLPEFVTRRRENWALLRQALEPLEQYLLFQDPGQNSRPSWFGFLMTVRPDSPVSRDELTAHLEAHNIQTRPLFARNLTRHPCFQAFKEGTDYRIAGTLGITDQVMNNSFWVGVYPGMNREMLDEIVGRIADKLAP